MSWLGVVGLVAAGLLVAAAGAALAVRRSREALVELARLIRPCVGMLRGVLRDPLVPRRSKVAVGVAVAYLLVPIDLVPDFLPVIGHLDDALVVAWAVRAAVRGAGRERVEAHWSGTPAQLDRVLRLAGVA